jgi:protein arginine kinase
MFEKMIGKPGVWLNAAGEESEIVLSSRVRLARNLHGHRFTHNAEQNELAEIMEKTRSAASDTKTFSDGSFIHMGKVSSLDRQFLAERHLVSREFLFNSTNRGLVVNSNEDVCLMINEEDHIRMQAFSAGFSLKRAFDQVDRLDTELTPRLSYAFSDRFGYLTACPTNVGTGLRASVLIHLPGLVHSKEINKLLDSLRKLNHSIRGLYGEGTDVMGNFFQLSNAVTLGNPESTIVNNLGEVVTKVIGYEKKARELLFSKARSLLEDKVWRAYGLLKYARSVSTKEALSLVSAVRMGVGVGIITDLDIRKLNELLVFIQPAHLQRLAGTRMEAQERDIARAEYIRKVLAG